MHANGNSSGYSSVARAGAAEVLEHFQWKSPDEIERYLESNRQDFADKLIDVL